MMKAIQAAAAVAQRSRLSRSNANFQGLRPRIASFMMRRSPGNGMPPDDPPGPRTSESTEVLPIAQIASAQGQRG